MQVEGIYTAEPRFEAKAKALKLKQEMAAAKVRRPAEDGPMQPSPYREERKAPSFRAAARSSRLSPSTWSKLSRAASLVASVVLAFSTS